MPSPAEDAVARFMHLSRKIGKQKPPTPAMQRLEAVFRARAERERDEAEAIERAAERDAWDQAQDENRTPESSMK